MWVEAGLDPDAFWRQSPASFQLVMRGVRKRLEREAEAAISLAYHTGAFSAAAQAGRLKKLSHYIRGPQKRQTPAEMLAILRQIKAGGADMTITKLERAN